MCENGPMKQRIAAWIAGYLIADDPAPELSRLDLMDRPID